MLETAKKVIRNSESLPSAPTLITELSTILKDDDATAGDFEKIVCQDTRLTENLLRLANAAYFGVRRERFVRPLPFWDPIGYSSSRRAPGCALCCRTVFPDTI
jgi:hypothetical protein